MKIQKITVLLLGIALAMISCEQEPYMAVPEEILIINNSDYTLHIKYDSDLFKYPFYYEDNFNFDTVPSGSETWAYISYNNYNLIMPDSTFSRIISKMKIFRIENTDTIYIATEQYDNRTDWESTAGTLMFEYWLKFTTEKLIVTNSMFNN